MLVLSRRVSEQIVIGGNISVTVLEIKGGQVRLGITAPKNVCVDRHEIHMRRSGLGEVTDRREARVPVLQGAH